MTDHGQRMTDSGQRAPASVSALVITKDEEANIGPCLASLQWADEIIVVDAESTDHTTDQARRFTDRIFVRPWPGYGPQKNFGMEQARSPWILIVDADERVPVALAEEIQAILRAPIPADIAGYEIPRKNFFYGVWIRHGGLSPDYQLRLLRRGSARYDDTLLHERLVMTGRIERLHEPFEHHSMPTVGHHVRKMMRNTTLAAQQKLKRRNRVTPLDLGGSHLVTFFKTYVIRGGWRDGVPGLIAAMFAAMHTFVKYAKAVERLQGERLPRSSEHASRD